MNQDMRKKLNLLVMLFLFMVILFNVIKGEKGISLKVEENGLTIAAGSGEPFYVAFNSIRNISLITNLKKGERVSGIKTKGISAGIWRNELYKEYTLFVNDKISSAIILETEEGIIAFNYESKKTTGQLYETLKDYVNSR